MIPFDSPAAAQHSCHLPAQLGSLSGRNAPGGTADVCVLHRWALPFLPGACCSPEQGQLRGGAEPSCPPAILVLHHPPPAPFRWGALLLSPPDTGAGVTSAALSSFAVDTKTPFTFFKVSSETSSSKIRTLPSCKLHMRKKTHNGYKNERTPIPMDFISLPPTSLTPVSVSGVSRGGAS